MSDTYRPPIEFWLTSYASNTTPIAMFWFVSPPSSDTQLIAQLQKLILSSNAKKTELLAAVAPILPLDMGMTICVYM